MDRKIISACAAVLFVCAMSVFDSFAAEVAHNSADAGVLHASAGQDARAGGIAAINAHEFSRAIEIFEAASVEDPFDDELKSLLGIAYSARGWDRVNEGDFDGAYQDFKRASVVEQEKTFETYLGLGYVSFKSGDNDDALYYLYDAVYINPDDGRGHELIGEIYYRRGKLRDAIAEWETSLEKAPGNEHLQARLAKAKKELGVEGSFTKRETYYFNIKYEGEEKRELGDRVLDILDRAYMDVGGDLDYLPREPVTVILYTREQFKDITDAPAWSGGIYDGNIRIPVGGRIDDKAFAAVLYHEYTHAVLHMVSGGRIPTWLDEGIAQYEERWVRRAYRDMAGKDPLPLSSLNGSFMKMGDPQTAKLAYAQSLSVIEYFVDRFGSYSLSKLVGLIGEGVAVPDAMLQVTGITFAKFESYWRNSL